MKWLLAIVVLSLAGCGTHVAQPAAPKAVVILGNHTTAAQCECPDASAANVRAEKWKTYAEKLETRLGIPHEDQQ